MARLLVMCLVAGLASVTGAQTLTDGIELIDPLAPFGDTPSIAASKANRLIRAGEYASAINVLEEALEHDPANDALNVLFTLARVQSASEKERLIDGGLALFFEQPSAACRIWARITELDASDEDAKTQLEHLRTTIRPKLDELGGEADGLIASREFTRAAELVTEINDLECGEGRAAALSEKIQAAYSADLERRISNYESRRRNGQCPSAIVGLQTLVANPWLSEQQAARSYLALGLCQAEIGEHVASRTSLERAFRFDPSVLIPGDLPAGLYVSLRQAHETAGAPRD